MTGSPEPSGVRISVETAREAFTKMDEMLRADGYSLEVAVDGGQLTLQVLAGPEACESCLAPKEVLGMIAADLLAKAGIDIPASAISLRYPVEHAT